MKKRVTKKATRKSSKGDDFSCDIKCDSKCKSKSGGCGYFLGFLGAAFYYVSTASSFGDGFVGLLKALVWPAFLVFELMKYLGM